MLSYLLHYKNKYPQGQVRSSESSLDVYDKDGNHAVALRKDGNGHLGDQSEVLGCSDRHDLAPIPKDARIFKLIDGKISQDEKAEERMKLKDMFLDKSGAKILSCFELSKAGFEFDEKQRMIKSPAK